MAERKKKKKVCCVIGGTSGLGKAIALGFAEKGYIVAVTGRDRNKIIRANEELGKFADFPLISKNCDVRKENSVKRFFKSLLKSYGRVDILVSAAGIHKKLDALKTDLDSWKEVLDVNLTGTFISNKIFGEYFCKRRRGCIINIGSLASYVALTETCAYSASKAGVVALTKSLAVEWAKYNVRVNAIIPGVFPTKLNKKALKDRKRRESILRNTPMKRFGKPDEIVSAALFLADDKSSFVTGASIPVDGGFLSWAGF